jgi:hypothetical protein
VTKDPQAAAPHVAHEIRMLRRAWRQHQRDPLAYTAWFVHCRNLMKFFDSEGQKDEIKVSAFVTGVDKEWQRGFEGITRPSNYDDYWNAVDKLAAHLTWDRTDPKWAKYPPSQEITQYLLGLSLLLLRVLPPDRVGRFGGVLL